MILYYILLLKYDLTMTLVETSHYIILDIFIILEAKTAIFNAINFLYVFHIDIVSDNTI